MFNTCSEKAYDKASILIGTLSGALVLVVLAAPLLLANQFTSFAVAIYWIFAPVCHQLPDRSFALLGFSWAVCQRCSGIYLGFFLTSLLPRNIHARLVPEEKRRNRVLAFTAPLLVDFVSTHFGLWPGHATVRFATGLLFGAVLSSLLVRAISEFLSGSAGKHTEQLLSNNEGGAA